MSTHFISDASLKRRNFRYMPAPGGGFIGYPAEAQPTINRKHIDGPLLYMRSGELHWLTLRERLLLWLGKTDAFALERKYRPNLSK